ncbi:3-dehydroquinate synthase [Klugiella xanthotipulae]
MASGKSSIGRRVAKLLGARFIDTDKVIVAEHGPIPALFEAQGEARFRDIEADTVRRVLGSPALFGTEYTERDPSGEGLTVVALGGGAVLADTTQDLIRDCRVVLVMTTEEAVLSRSSLQDRPLLAHDPAAWGRILSERLPLYKRLARVTFDTSVRPKDAIAADIAEWVRPSYTVEEENMTINQPEMTTISVAGEHPYDILVGRDLVRALPDVLGNSVHQVLIVHPPTLGAAAARLREILRETYAQVLLAEVPDAEAAKRVEVAAFCWQVMGQADFTRTDAVIGFGGGAVTDLAGFVAATWLRGVKLVQIPTTVLGIVDASVGGKTGINTAEGKNLVGAFYSPAAVLADLDNLATLPENEIRAGFAEVVKCGFIAEPEILEILEADITRAIDPLTPEFRRVIELSIRVKARVVGEDFTEQGLREILNYGHTLGHAIEHAERYQWRHGAAIAVGMMFAAELGRLAGRLDDATVDRHRSILKSLTLPTTYPAGRWPGLLAAMQRDKKARAGMLRFIVLDRLGVPAVLAGPDESMLFTAYQEIAS